MASPGASSLLSVGWLFVLAMVTSLLWYMFWIVMSPVEQDISWLVNYFLFMKLHLKEEVDIYNVMKEVHNWLPLLVITIFILSKVALVYRDYLQGISQLVYVVVILYNSSLVVFLFHSGQKVLELFTVTLPLYLLKQCGPHLSQFFSPHTLWIPTSFSLLLYYLLCRLVGPSVDKRSHRCCGLWEPSLLGAVKRVGVVFLLPLLMTGLTYWLMEVGCRPCSGTPGFEAKSPPPRPKLIGHRGCAFDFPENSLAAFESAVLLPDVVGLETDIFLSMDGVPYLMHDKDLIRTTDVETKCPSQDPYANSTLLYYHNGSCPLKDLNVGGRFLRSVENSFSPEERTLFQSQKLPTFKEFLAVAKRSGRHIMFDANKPPVGHPYHASYLNRTLEDIVASGFLQDKVWWLPDERRDWVHRKYPHLILTTRSDLTPFEKLESEHIQQMNDYWGLALKRFREYQEANLSITMFFVDSVFMYNYAWCMGVGTVTTSNCKLLSTVQINPFLQICRQWYDGLNLSHPVLLCGVGVVLIQFLLLSCWEALKLTGHCSGSIKR